MALRFRSRLRAWTVVAAVCIALFASGCSRASKPRWISLSALFDPERIEYDTPATATGPGGRSYSLIVEDGRTWIATVIEGQEWTGGENGVWRAPGIGVRARGSAAPEDSARLASSLGAYVHRPRKVTGMNEPDTDGSFQAGRAGVLLRLPRGARPPSSSTLTIRADRGERREDGGFAAWRTKGQRFSGEAIPTWPGESFELVTEVPPRSALRFATCSEPAFTGVTGLAGQESVHFRVLADGEEVFAFSQAPSDFTWHTVALDQGDAVALRFEVEGPVAFTCFFSPIIGPASIGSPGARPWKGGRPDLVVFLADTFRADNMGTYGGELGLTPFLDELAEESLVFSRAWSVGTYTLPAHASMFTSVFPHQVGILGTGTALPEAMTTIAETLRRNGYRTGAITDAVVVSQRFGLDQGFEWFDERKPEENEPMDSTLERVRKFLEGDDGRPHFLFVQSYRVHLPYRVSAETRAEHGVRLGIEGDFSRWFEELKRIGPARQSSSRPQVRARTVEQLRAHYLGGVIDLDRGMRAFMGLLEESGLMKNGTLLFTSDHGEAFDEHGIVYHTDQVWEELARVPLFLHGPGIEPGTKSAGASLIDIPPTLAALAGIPAHPTWLGRSLLNLEDDRPMFVFECQGPPESTMAIIDGPHKLFTYDNEEALSEGRLKAAFDLESDPGEATNLLGDEPAWAAELFERTEDVARGLLQPVVQGSEATLDEEKLEELRAMGYGGD